MIDVDDERTDFLIYGAVGSDQFKYLHCPTCKAFTLRAIDYVEQMAGKAVPCLKCGAIHVVPEEPDV